MGRKQSGETTSVKPVTSLASDIKPSKAIAQETIVQFKYLMNITICCCYYLHHLRFLGCYHWLLKRVGQPLIMTSDYQ